MKQILVFLLFACMLCWFMFAPVYKHVLILRQALLQKEVDYVLEVGASGSYGYVGDSLLADSRMRLEERGFDPNLLRYEVSTTNGSSGNDSASPVPRGTGIRLTITYPYGSLFGLDRLIGIEPPGAEERMGASGVKMSEYIP